VQKEMRSLIFETEKKSPIQLEAHLFEPRREVMAWEGGSVPGDQEGG
jgi:hypothetical protein